MLRTINYKLFQFCKHDHYNTYWCADNSDAYYSKVIHIL